MIVLIIVLNAVFSFQHSARDATTQAALKQAVTAGKQALVLSDNALAAAKSSIALADAYKLRADSLKHRADSLELHVAALRGRYTQVAKTAPDTCRELAEAATLAIDSLATEAGVQKARAEAADSASANYRFALDTTQAALTNLRASVAHLSSAAVAVGKASRPSLFARILPHAGFGGAAGINPLGRPDAVVGVTFGWAF